MCMEGQPPWADEANETEAKSPDSATVAPEPVSIATGFAPMNQGTMLTGTAQMPTGQLIYLQPPSGAAKVIGILVIVWGVLLGVLSNGLNLLFSVGVGSVQLIVFDVVNILLGVGTVVGGVMLMNYQRRGIFLLFTVLVLGAVVGAVQLNTLVDYDQMLEEGTITQDEYDALQNVDNGLVQGIGLIFIVFCNAMCGLFVAIPMMISNNGLDDSKLFG